MQKKIQYALFFIQVFLSRHFKQIMLSSVIGFLSMMLVFQIYPLYVSLFRQKKDRIGIVGKFNEKTLPLFIRNQISLGLTSLDYNGEASPGAALSWEIDANKTTYIFHLAKDLKWHNGKKLISNDINYNFEGMALTAVDDDTLKVTLKEPYAPLPVVLSQPLLRHNLVGLGQYKSGAIIQNEGFIKELRLVSLDTGHRDITYKFYSNLDEAVNSFKMGEIDILKNISDIGDLSEWKNVKIDEVSLYDRIVLILINLNKGYFREKEIRQAFNYAIPKMEKEEKAISPISPLSWAYSTKIRLYNYDPEVAENLLSKSQLASSSSDIVLSTYANLLPAAQIITESLEKAGINLKVKVEREIPEDYDLFLTVLPIPSDPDQYIYWQSMQKNTNFSNYNNPKIDKLLEDGRKTHDKETRKKIYADFQKYLVDDSPVVFLYYPKVYTVTRNR